MTALEWVALTSLLAWLVLVFCRGRFWRTRFLTFSPPPPAAWPDVVAVVPARDEAESIAATIASLRRQDYPGRLRVVVVDDCSTDGTAEVAARAADDVHPGCAGAVPEVLIVRGEPRPSGWTGKLWAQQRGVAEAERRWPGARWLWLTDADVTHAPGTLSGLVATAEAERLVLLSLMVRLHCRAPWEKLLIPPFVFFFQKLYPFEWVNDPARRTAAAAGGCCLVRRQTLAEAGGVAAIRGALIDDCSLAALLKARGDIRLGLAADSHSLRRYPRLAEVWSMVARTAYTQLGYSPAALAQAVFGMLLVYQAPWICVAAGIAIGAPLAAALGAAATLAMLGVYAPTVRSFRLPPVWAATLPLAALLYTLMTIDSARRHRLGRGGEWKGRTFDRVETEAGS